MQERVKTSFIPKASLEAERKRPTGAGAVGIVNVLSSLVLMVAIIAAIGLFLFEQFTVQNIDRKRVSLDRARAAFEPATIRELSHLNTRLSVGGALLDQHVAPSYLFDEIERLTLSSVRFNDFAFGDSGPGRVVVTMSGEAKSFNALALQSDAFGNSEFFTEPIFSDLNLDDTGNVIFSFTGVVDVNQLRFRAPEAVPVPTPEVTL